MTLTNQKHALRNQQLLNRGRLRLPPSVVIALLILGVVLVWALFPGVAPQSPVHINSGDVLRPPGSSHPLGTDQLGRDVFARLIDGARSAIVGPLVVASLSVVVSTVLALAAGYLGGWVDTIIGRIVDVLYSVPAVVVAIVVVGVVGGGYWIAIAVLLVFGLPQNIRVLRAAVMDRAQLPYVEAARTLGVPPLRIVFGHLLPAIRAFVVASFFLQLTYGIVDLSALSFLGLGVPPGSPDWGRMLAENRAAISGNFWAAAAPGLALVAAAVSLNLVGDWLYGRIELAEKAK